jgi:hypothetical protein
MSLAKQAAVAGAPGVLDIQDADGKTHTFLVSRPSASDLIVMRKWILAQSLPDQGQAQGLTSAELEGLKPEERALLIREYARAKGSRREPTENEAVLIVFSPAGVAMQVWLAARRHQPGLKKEEVGALVTESNYEQVINDLDRAIGAAEDPDDPKAPAGSRFSPSS